MRDQIKDREYFNEFLQEEQARITRLSDKLANGEVKPERQLAVKTIIHDLTHNKARNPPPLQVVG